MTTTEKSKRQQNYPTAPHFYLQQYKCTEVHRHFSGLLLAGFSRKMVMADLGVFTRPPATMATEQHPVSVLQGGQLGGRRGCRTS